MASEELHKLKRLIRIGLTADDLKPNANAPDGSAPYMPPKKSPDLLKTRINEHVDVIRRLHLTPAEELMFKTLQAEFEYGFGNSTAAAKVLSDEVDRLGLRKALLKWNPEKQRFNPDNRPAALLRQQIWALMGAAFYWDYAACGNLDAALTVLRRLERLIDAELAPVSKQPPHGTRARTHYFCSQVYRTQRNFSKSEEHLLESQQHAERRLQREIDSAVTKHDLQRREQEYQFGVICTARVLGTLGRLAVVQGRLQRALQIFLSARTLLLPSGQEALKLVIDSHLVVVRRRLAEPASNAWRSALRELKTLDKKFVDSEDWDGARRCEQEAACAHLEHAEARSVGERERSLAAARKWIELLEQRAEKLERERGTTGSPERYRVHLFNAWMAVLQPTPQFDHAFDELNKAKALAHGTNYGLELAGCDAIDVHKVEGLVRAAHAVDTGKDYSDGISALDFLAQSMREAHAAGDKLLESEAMLRLALVETRVGQTLHAQSRLDTWNNYAAFVENVSLKALHRQVVAALDSPMPIVGLNVRENTDRLQELLFMRATARAKTGRQAAANMGIGYSTYRYIKERLDKQRSN